MGKFCIAHNHSGHAEQIIHKENGWLIDMHQSDWKNHLLEALELNPKERERIKQNAKETSLFGHNQRDKEFIKMLEELSS
jgi:hypothetical protein